MADNEWIIPPELSLVVHNFMTLYEYLKDRPGRIFPIMILGDRGVGKSLFCQIYKTLYLKDNPGKKYVRLNAASLMETLVDSELFGHKKGAFTGAVGDRSGLVENADLLILEEIGDIPHYVQAKLLTFLEDRKFRRVGDNEEKAAKKDLHIIATTNKKQEDMRPDFYDRFIKFTIPPLYERRLDIFYYMLHFTPSIIPTLRTWEIMALLAHPWPGNVRELLAVSTDMESSHSTISKRVNPKSVPYHEQTLRMRLIKKEHTQLNWYSIHERFQSMQRAGINMKLLEKLLNRYNLGFVHSNWKPPWAKEDFSSPFSSSEAIKKMDALLSTKTYRSNLFPGVEVGLPFYGMLFWKDVRGSTNLLSVRSEEGRSPIVISPFHHIKKPTDKHIALVKSILEYCFMRRINNSMQHAPLADMDNFDYEEWVNKAFNIPALEPEEDKANDGAKEPKENPFDMKQDDLLRAYYQYLLKKSGSKEKAAALAGVNKNTFYSKLKRLDII